MAFKDYYKILGIHFPSNEGEIKTSYRKMSLKWHPDKNPGVDTSNFMVVVNEAYYILNNTERKRRYDTEYIRYIDFIKANKSKIVNNSYSYSEQYTPYDFSVQKDIKDAHEKASKLVAEFLDSLKKASKDAARGAWDKMLPYLVVSILFSLIILIVRPCK